jgi:hypothetical protein
MDHGTVIQTTAEKKRAPGPRDVGRALGARVCDETSPPPTRHADSVPAEVRPRQERLLPCATGGGARSAHHRARGAAAAHRDAWADWLKKFPLDRVLTLTYSDDYADRHRIYCFTSALNDFERWLYALAPDTPMPQFFVAAESHWLRDVPHLHALLDSRGVPPQTLWRSWFSTRGRSHVSEPRSDAARVYCAKYTLKDTTGDSYRFHLDSPLSRRAKARWAGAIADNDLELGCVKPGA